MPVQKFRLEDQKIFPIIAWIVIILFAIFTYLLATNLQAQLGELDNSIHHRSNGTSTAP